MKGSHEVIVQNKRLRYRFVVHRNITILRGDSATGKTTLIEMIKNNAREGIESGIEVICEKKCVVLEKENWERNLKEYKDSIVFIDEGNAFVKSEDFATCVKKSDNYYVIATRDSLFNLPYSIREIYGIRNTSGNRYQGTKRLYSELYHLYNKDAFAEKPDKVIVEDSNSAYQFFDELCKREGIYCEPAGGKSEIYRCVQKSREDRILVIADGAAFGPEIERVMSLKYAKKMVCFLPESFEWLILNSGLIKEKELSVILENPSDFIESERYFSWERFFTKLLTDKTKDSYLAYRKDKLNPTYFQEVNRAKIVNGIQEVAGSKII